jgi:hypothetical protein
MKSACLDRFANLLVPFRFARENVVGKSGLASFQADSIMRWRRDSWMIGLSVIVITATPALADDAKTSSKQQLDQLLEAYKAYGLPLPPKDAPLVRYEVVIEESENGKKPPPRHYLAFLIKAESKDGEPELLSGLWRWSGDMYTKREVVEPTRALLRIVNPNLDGDLLLAIQCHSRGWHELAPGLLESYVKEWIKNEPKIELALGRAWRGATSCRLESHFEERSKSDA